MSIRAIILGLVGSAFIAGAGYLNDNLLRNTFLVGNHLPVSVFGLLILVVIVINPVLGRLRCRLRPSELAVTVAMMLAACSIPGSGLMRTFPTSLVVPIQYSQDKPYWSEHDILGYVPGAMLPGGGRYDPAVVRDFLQGIDRETEGNISLADVPWGQWAQALASWTPLILLLGIAGISLAVIVHRQWSKRELLRYPIATFASSLMGGRAGDGKPIYRTRIFWIGLITVLVIQVINGLGTWNPNEYLRVPLRIDLWMMLQKWPTLPTLLGFKGNYLSLPLYPAVMAFGFMLASEVSLTLGLSPLLLMAATTMLAAWGVEITSEHGVGGPMNWQRFGSYVGMILLIAYTGRRYYGHVLRRAVTFSGGREADSTAVWACRILLLSVVGLVAMLTFLGLNWPYSVMLVGLMLMMFLVMARINAETGLFFCQCWWMPIGVFSGMFGFAAMGPKAIAIVALVSAIFTIDPRECLIPFVTNGLKMCDDSGVRRGRTGWAIACAFILALVVAMVVALWANYNYPAFEDKWANQMVPDITFGVVETAVKDLKAVDGLKESVQLSTWQRIASTSPNPTFLKAAGAGLVLVLLFSALRLRSAKFPLHPVVFLVWGTYPMQCFSFSFLVGWMIKSAVMKFGGSKTYHNVTALMFGIVAGDLLGALTVMSAVAIHYGAYGTSPLWHQIYRVFPG